jgi:glycosyltransferase involved in cell wall biosynthesis
MEGHGQRTILYTITSYPPAVGGAQLHTHSLVKHIGREHPVRVAAFWDRNRTDWLLGTTIRAPSTPHTYTIDGVPVTRLHLSHDERLHAVLPTASYYLRLRASIDALAGIIQPRLAELAAAQRPALVHNIRIGREPLSFASWRLARSLDVPFVFTPLHHPRWVGWRYRAFIDLYHRSDLVLVLTEAERRAMIELGVSSSHIQVVGNGPVLADAADAQNFRARHRVDGPLVLFLGQHFAYKGFRALLAAAPLVWQRFPDARFAFLGPAVGNSESAFRHVDRRILRLGEVDLQTKTDALAACDLLCVPSTQESFGGVYTEAWSFGKPVIGARIPAVSEVIADGVDGFLVAQRPEEIADRIVTLLADGALAQRMGAAGKEKVEQRYTWRAIAQRMLAAYRSVL